MLHLADEDMVLLNKGSRLPLFGAANYTR